jgi:hypothetical protein
MKTNTIMIIPCSVLLGMKHVSNDRCRDNRNTFYIQYLFFFENHAFYEITWKNIELDKPQMTNWPMRIACWIRKATNTHSEYVSVIALPLQQ